MIVITGNQIQVIDKLIKLPKSAKRAIEQKKTRLNKLVEWEYISREQANKQLKEYTQFVCRYFGC